MNDRALRSIVSSLGGVANGFPREDGFDITVASEVMAIFCLASDLDDLQKPARQHRRRLYARPQAGARRRPQGARRDDRAAQGRALAQPGADPGRHARLRPWRTVRQHRARLQLGAGDHDRTEARRLRGDRSRLRRRSRRRRNSSTSSAARPGSRPTAPCSSPPSAHSRCMAASRRRISRPRTSRRSRRASPISRATWRTCRNSAFVPVISHQPLQRGHRRRDRCSSESPAPSSGSRP